MVAFQDQILIAKMSAKRRRNDEAHRVDDDSFPELLSSLPPPKKSGSGTRKPSNTETMSPMRERLSALALGKKSPNQGSSEKVGQPWIGSSSSFNFSPGDFMSDEDFMMRYSQGTATNAKSSRLLRTTANEERSSSKKRISVYEVDILAYPPKSCTEPEFVPQSKEKQEGGRKVVNVEELEAPVYANLDGDDFMNEAEFKQWLAQQETAFNEPNSALGSTDMIDIENFQWRKGTFKRGKTVELQDGSFLRIKRLLQNDRGEVFLSGPKFVRSISLGRIFSRERLLLNEVCWLVELTVAESKRNVCEKDIQVPVSEVETIRKLYLTNQPYHELNMSNATDTSRMTKERARVEGPLFCRVKFIRADPGKINVGKHFLQSVITNLNPDECDSQRVPNFDKKTLKQGVQDVQCRIDASSLRESWRGETPPGGIDGTGDLQYTAGDGFCGAGGMSSGMKKAGVRIKWAFDSNQHAIKSYGGNFSFPETSPYWAEVQQFLSLIQDELKVCIVHLSPPCQTFSSAHTVQGAKDDDNSAAICCVREVVSRVKPRILTMEETYGLVSGWPDYLWMIIRDLQSLGYSIKWKVFNLLEHGLPQRRKRLVLVAAGPGEVLPPFPKPTHGIVTPGFVSPLRPFTTIKDWISGIPDDASHHDIRLGAKGYPKTPYPIDSHVKSCITTSGGDGNWHPSGLRPFTNRELARLQTFDMDHFFCGQETRKQIGNAVPPIFGKALYEEIVKSLKKTDGVPL
jgi:DNA (cytosine-5)-methyltransferase 1